MALHDYVQQLKQIELFQALSPEALRLIAFSAEARILHMSDILFQEGEPAEGGFVVLSGGLTLTRAKSPDSVLQHIGPGALIGEMALITATKRPATATAAEVTGVLRISRVLFHRVLQEFPECASRIHSAIAARTAQVTAGLEDFRNRHLNV
jgi:CRP-like cAMP-binding protein